MTEGRRIALNVAATYGRSLFALVCGLFTGRWLLMALGTTDYGLYGLIGGLAAFVAFFNTLLTVSVERFFAFAVGEGKSEECQRWFSVAAALHGIVSVVLVGIGYPVGAWAIRHYLNVPAERIEDCLWVFRFVCANCLVGMATVPMSAMYRAKQRIAELTVYEVFQVTANVVVLGYAVTHPGNWLVAYAGCWCVFQTLPLLLIAVNAFRKFPECRFRLEYAWNRDRAVRLVDFMFSRFVNLLAQILSGQGLSIVVNKYLGATRNASMTASNGLSVQVMNLIQGREAIVESPSGAFRPYIVHYAETFIIPAAVGEFTIRPYGESEGQEIATIKAFVRK